MAPKRTGIWEYNLYIKLNVSVCMSRIGKNVGTAIQIWKYLSDAAFYDWFYEPIKFFSRTPLNGSIGG